MPEIQPIEETEDLKCFAAARCIDLYNNITPEGIEDLSPGLRPIIRAMYEIGARLKGRGKELQRPRINA